MKVSRTLLYVLAWTALLAAMVISFRPAIPVIWGDTPKFLESALRTSDAGRPAVVSGRDPGYPEFLALIFAVGGDLNSIVVLQQAAWALLMLALAATAQIVTGSLCGFIPVLLMALYPGLMIYRNVITAEIPYALCLNLAAFALVLALGSQSSTRAWMVIAAILSAAAAACVKSQAMLLAIVVMPIGIWIIKRDNFRQGPLVLLACALAIVLLASASRIAAHNTDASSILFVPKTLVCNHADIVLASDTAKRDLAGAAGDRSQAVLEQLAADLRQSPGTWPILGFFGDRCLYDADLDRQLMAGGMTAVQLADLYWRIFLDAVFEHPVSYLRKLGRQLYYGAWSAWPAQGLEPTIPVSTDDIEPVFKIMSQYGLPIPTDAGTPVRTWYLSRLGWLSIYLFKGLSAAFVVSAVCCPVIAVKARQPLFFSSAGVLIAVWLLAIVSSAAAHTLDVRRYLVPATPMVALLLAIVLAELGHLVVSGRRRSI
jgi:hypothetical protein